MAGFDIKALANTLIDIGQAAGMAFVPGGTDGPIGRIAAMAIDGLQNAVLHPDVAADPDIAPRAEETLEQLVARVERHADEVMDQLGDDPQQP